MHGNGGNITDRIHIPDLTEQFFLGKYMVWMLRQERQQIKLFGRKRLLHTVHIDTSRSLINTDTTDLHDIILLLLVGSHQSLITSHVRLHTGYQFTGAERFGHIVIRTQP